MKNYERIRAIARTPRLVWDVLVRGRYAFIYDQMPVVVRKMTWQKRLNLFSAGANLLFRRIQGWSMPLHMQFELTNFCNLRCPVCPTGTGAISRKAQSLSPALFTRLVNQVGPYLLTASLWGWGEPLLHPRLRDMMEIVSRHDFTTFFSTNGQRLNDDRALSVLLDYPPTYLIVAIDGLTDETNSVFRVGARLDPILEGVRRLASLKRERNVALPILHMRFIVMKHNQHQVPSLLSFAREHGFEYLTVRTLSIIDSEQPDAEHYQLLPDDSAFCAYQYENAERIEKDDFYCLEPFWFPTVFADGTVVSCEQDFNAQLPMGVLSEKIDFRSIWQSKKAAAVRRKVKHTHKALSFCRNCPYRDRQCTDVSVAAYHINERINLGHLA